MTQPDAPSDRQNMTVAVDASRQEKRLSLVLGAAIICLLLALPFLFQGNSVFLQPPIQDHARQKQKEEIGKRFQEGVMMLHAKQYEHALTAFHRVLQLDPKMPEAHVNAGYALLGMGNHRAAADFFDTATTLRPTQLNAYYGLGEALQAMDDKQGALQAMEAYLHRSPADDPFRRKAEAATWELRAELAKEKPASPPGEASPRQGKAGAGRP